MSDTHLMWRKRCKTCHDSRADVKNLNADIVIEWVRKMSSFKTYPRGDFSFILDCPSYKGTGYGAKMDKLMFEEAFKAIESVEGGWEFMRDDEPGEGGYMFGRSKNEKIRHAIDDAISKNDSCGHSGASYGLTMRAMQYLARNDWLAFIKYWWPEYQDPEEIKKLREEFLAFPKDASLAEQAAVWEKFKNVPMTYAEMRERFG